MNNIGQMMKQAQKLQEKMQKVQKEVEEHTEEGSAGGGMVKVIINGKNDMQKLSIDPSLINPDEVEVLEDLITAAFNDARQKMEAYSAEKMSGVAGGLPGGLKLPF